MRRMSLLVFLAAGIFLANSFSFAEQRAQDEVLEEGLPYLTLGEKICEESRKREKGEQDLLLSTEEKLYFFRERVNSFLKEQLNQKDAQKYFLIGERDFEQKRYNQARGEFERAIAIYPGHEKAAKYIRKMDKKEAEEYFRKGKRYFKQKKYYAAREDFEKVLSIYPDHKKAAKYIRKIDKLANR